MQLASVFLGNFKRYESQYIDLSSPITLLLGPNSSGKSSIIKALLALKQTVSPSNEYEALATQGEYVDLGTYKDFVFQHDNSKQITLSLELSNLSKAIPYLDMSQAKACLSLVYDYDYITDQARIVKLTLSINSKDLPANSKSFLMEVTRKKTRSGYWLKYSGSLSELLNRNFRIGDIKSEDTFSIKHIERLRFVPVGTHNWSSTVIFNIFSELVTLFAQHLERDVFYLGPLRSSPARSYIRTSHSLAVGPRGEHTPSVLSNLEKRQKKVTKGREKSELTQGYKGLGDWLQILFPGKRVSTETHAELVKLKVLKNDQECDSIIDVGFGFSQIFPILVQAAVMPFGSTLIIEQPELHLHPMAQANLAKVIVSATTLGRRFIIETHSEHFFRGLQLAISEYKLQSWNLFRKEHLKIYYVPEPPEELTLMELNDWGELVSQWPSGFFDEAYKLAYQLLLNKTKSIEEASKA